MEKLTNITNVTIVGREQFAVDAAKQLIKQGLQVNKIITDSQGLLFQYAQLAGIPCQLKNTNSKVTEQDIYSDTHVLVSLHNYLYITPKALAKTGKAIGYHPSMLPDFKGRRAIQDALTVGVNTTGGTLYNLDGGYDTGEIISQQSCRLYEADTPKVVWRRLEAIGLKLLATETANW